MDKVYVVEGSTGAYDDVRSIIVGIYSSEELAKEHRDEFLKGVINYRKLYTSEQIKVNNKALWDFWNIEEDDETFHDEMDAELSEYHTWKNSDSMELSTDVTIKEILVNKLLYSFG